MTGLPWRVRWEDGPEGRYRVGTVEPGRTGADGRDVEVLLLLGRGDSLELRAGTGRRLAGRGARVVAVEHVGQGASPGLGDQPDSVHVTDFATHVSAAVHEADGLQGRAVLLAHSMGGLVALHLLAARPQRFSGAVLTSPMWGWAGWLPARLTARLASLAVRTGGAARLAAGERSFSTASCLQMRGAAGDQALALTDFARRHPDLVRGGSTWGWTLAASRSMQQVSRLPLEGVSTRVTVISCSRDRSVSLSAHRSTAVRFPAAQVVELEAGHDPFVADEVARDLLWAEIDPHLDGRTAQSGASARQPPRSRPSG